MIKAIAIDDEPLALKIIQNFCEQNGQVKLIKSFTKANQALDFLQTEQVELLFLDVNMPAISGIDLYKKIDKAPMLIFTTAYSEYAVEGFNLNAVDYLVKPFSYSRFEVAIDRAIQQNRQVELPAYISIRADYSLIKVVLNKLIYIESIDNYIKIHLLDQKPILARMTLAAISELLPEKHFVRIHRSYIIAMDKILSVRHKKVSIGSVELPIGAYYEQQFMLQMNKPT